MKCSSQDPQVVDRDLVKGGGEVAVEDETTSFIDDNERVDNPNTY